MDFPLSSIIHLQQIYWEHGEEEGLYPPCRGDILCEPLSQYRCMNLPKTKTDDNDRAHTNDDNTLSWHIVDTSFWTSASRSNSSHLFRNLKETVQVQTLSYRKKITYHQLLIGFLHKLISMQDAGHNMLHLHVAQQLPSLYMWWVISPTNDKDAQLNRQFPFGFDLNKILPDLLKLRTKTEKPAIQQFSQHTYANTSKAQSDSKLCSWLIFS